MENRNVLSLSTSKTISNPNLKCEKIIEYFLASVKDQSNFFMDSIVSLKHLVFEYSDNPSSFRDNVQSELTILFKRYFTEVEVNVELNGLQETDEIIRASTLGLKIKVTDSDGNKGILDKEINLEKYITK